MSGVRRLARLSAVGTAVATVAFTASWSAYGHGGGGDAAHEAREAFLASGAAAEAVTSDNVQFLANFPETQGISGDFSLSTEHFYVSSLDSITVFDISDPEAPAVTGVLDNLTFENEAMNYGEVTLKGGKLRQFVLVGVDLHQASSSDPQHVNPGDGLELVIVDVTDPANPHIRSRVAASSSTHTVTCVLRTNCKWAYSAGSRGTFSIFDLRDWNNPKEIDSDPNTEGTQGFGSPGLDPNEVFSRGAGHKWNFVGDHIGIHTGSGGSAAFDVSNPRKPVLLTTTTKKALTGPWNNFIHHNSWQPHIFRFEPNREPSLKRGNVLLVTEEDYEQTDCSLAGSFQTWKVDSFKRDNAITALDKVELADLGGLAEGITPQLAFCSAHWFDYHHNGIVAIGYYGGGMRLLDVRDPRDIKAYGFAQGGGQVWDAYWVPQRDEDLNALRKKTNIVYSIDLVRGLDVYKVDMPSKRATDPDAETATSDASQQMAAGVLALGLAGYLAIGAVRRRRAAA
jgi:hypothetical protein